MTALTQTHTHHIIRSDRQNERKTPWAVKQDLYSPHFLAQDLNNEASTLISRGENIPQAIHLLVRALELSKWSPPTDDGTDSREPCSCESCSLDASLFHGDEDLNNNYDDYEKPRYKRQRQRRSQTHELHQQDSNLDDKKGFIYRRPLRVTQTSIDENHYLGSTLTVMVLFNLALAHQLLGMSMPSEWGTFDEKMQNMDKALKLYELCVHASPDCNCSDAAGLRLKLLVMNNLSQIHKLSGYPKKYRMCLEYLMRALMFVSHGREGGWEYDYEILTPGEMDSIYRNMQSSSVLIGKEVHAADRKSVV